MYTGFNPTGEVELVKDINAAIPTAKIFGGDGVCSSAVTNPAKGGFPKSIAPLFFCTQPALHLASYPGGKAFLAAYKAKYGVAGPRAVLDLRLRGDEARAARRSRPRRRRATARPPC